LEIVKKTEYFTIFLREKCTKTNIYHLRTNKGDEYLGEIKWYSKWRRYAFYPDYGTIYEETCLANISQFISDVNKEHCDRMKD